MQDLKPGSQNHRILSRLKRGPVTNAEMIDMNVFKYTSRISDLRARGFVIVAHDQGGGLWLYRLLNPNHK